MNFLAQSLQPTVPQQDKEESCYLLLKIIPYQSLQEFKNLLQANFYQALKTTTFVARSPITLLAKSQTQQSEVVGTLQ